MKHTYQLRGMAFTLGIRTTISPRRWQPWTAGIAVGYMNGRSRQKSKTLYSRGERKEALLWASAPPRSWYVWFSVKIGIFSKLFGHTGQLLRAQRSTPLSVSSTAKLVRVVQCKNWYFFKTIWAHRSTFAIPSSYACRGRTVLRFPTNSYHLFTVELV